VRAGPVIRALGARTRTLSTTFRLDIEGELEEIQGQDNKPVSSRGHDRRGGRAKTRGTSDALRPVSHPTNHESIVRPLDGVTGGHVYNEARELCPQTVTNRQSAVPEVRCCAALQWREKAAGRSAIPVHLKPSHDVSGSREVVESGGVQPGKQLLSRECTQNGILL
jgi:hypothetical protein